MIDKKKLAYLLNSKNFYFLAVKISPFFAILSGILITIGLTWGLFFAPSDYYQGDGFRIIYIHVPAAFLSLFIYTVLSFCSLLYLVFKIKTADILAHSNAIIGMSFTLIALITGSIWGKPMWGTWWIWDARLTSELILLFLYIGYLSLRDSFQDNQVASKVSSYVALFGVINVPIIHFSVVWWNTLHQGATLSKLQMPSIAPTMLYPLLISIAGFFALYIVLLLHYSRIKIINNEQNTKWINNLC